MRVLCTFVLQRQSGASSARKASPDHLHSGTIGLADFMPKQPKVHRNSKVA